ncbi:MAG: quercetin 2,3-dioxygenase [Solirubrobacteraceae bacterium]
MTDIWFLHNRVRVHISAEQTDDSFALLESIAPAGDHTPLHVHHRDDEGFYVLEGELTLWAGDDKHVLRAGESVFAPRGVPHTLRVGDRDARWLVTSTPAGFEAFVRAVGSTDPQAALPSPEELTRIASQDGIEILGPPGMLPAELQGRAA